MAKVEDQTPQVSSDPSAEAVRDLTLGLTTAFSVPLGQVSAKLDELQQSQEAMIGRLQTESNKLTSLPDAKYIQQTINQVSVYQGKVVQLRKDMFTLTERMQRLKRRAAALQQRKVQAETQIAEQRERNLLREQQLTAKPSKTLLTQSAEAVPSSPPSSSVTAIPVHIEPPPT